ncbi:U6 snRNA-associated Sm-like protein LSm1 [Lachnellula hyalina]|uniref:U6 snRNA-associated Sm-like protein LSm1 n=1 Tax=Lachnellula hyalina TaxID=1316788 RepID=A0A8H8R7D1_9HELO|nr:U6 snRNA-associated Sm-like protein LSm1 [Lachnellula hyalina]TVY29709.1 U6 snRNA-associated Sm-like protein LSm1 [Lachnellula hyalina]
MEHLNLHDNEMPPPQQGGAQTPMQQMQPLGPGMLPPPSSQQLPPQMFTTAAQLLDLTDTNLVLQSTIERIFVAPSSANGPGLYADVNRGIFLVRGENVLLLGEIDLDKDDDEPPGYERADVETVHRLQKEQKAKDARREKIVKRRLGELGFEGENAGEALI